MKTAKSIRQCGQTDGGHKCWQRRLGFGPRAILMTSDEFLEEEAEIQAIIHNMLERVEKEVDYECV